MRYECRFNLAALAVSLLQNPDDIEMEKKYDDVSAKQKQLFGSLFWYLQNKKIDCVYYAKGKNLYVLTRSAKDPDAIQNTCFWLRGSEMVALSDRQYKTFADMRRDYLPDNTVIHTF